MKLDKNTFKQLRIPTSGMQPFNIVKHQERLMITGMFDELKQTRAFRENGMLHNTDDKSPAYVCFIQREDGLMVIDVASTGIVYFDIIKEHLDPELKADVILCPVPADEISYLNSEYGALLFIGRHHPDHQTRVDALGKYCEINPPKLNEEQKAEARIWLKEAAARLGINYAQEDSSRTH